MCRFLHFLTAYIIKGSTAGHITGLTWKSILPHLSKIKIKILGSYHLLCVTMETRGTPFQNACFDFNKYLWGVKFTQQPDCNTEQKKVLSYHSSANIYKKYYQRPQWGFDLVILGAQWGQKLRNYLKKVKALLHNRINCIKVVLKSHVYIIKL